MIDKFKDKFKQFPKPIVLVGLSSVIDTTKINLEMAKTMDKEKYIELMEKVLKEVEKDLKELMED